MSTKSTPYEHDQIMSNFGKGKVLNVVILANI